MSANGVSGPHGSDRTGPAEPAPQRLSLDDVSFGEVVRAMNPLQYLPVIGTIYRVATGDAAPSAMRVAVSAVMGVVTGGPIGLLGSIIGSLAEQVFHIEGHVREALAPASPPTAGTLADHSPPKPSAATARAVAAYRTADLLGAM